MAKNYKKTDDAFDCSMSNPKGTFIQNISYKAMDLYDDLQKMSNITKDATLAVLKSMKVRPRALIRILGDYGEGCMCSELKSELRNVIYCVEDMIPGGDTRLFVCHSKKNFKTRLEFVCIAVRMYKFENENVCDFCVLTYSYAKSIDKEALALGIGTMSGGVTFGALAGLGIATGGVGLIILGSVSAICGIVTILCVYF